MGKSLSFPDNNDQLPEWRPLAFPSGGRGEASEREQPMGEATRVALVYLWSLENTELDVRLAFAHPQGKGTEREVCGSLREGKDVLASDRERRSMAGEEQPSSLEPDRTAIPPDGYTVAKDAHLDEAHVGVFGVLQEGDVPLGRRRTARTTGEPQRHQEEQGGEKGAERGDTHRPDVEETEGEQDEERGDGAIAERLCDLERTTLGWVALRGEPPTWTRLPLRRGPLAFAAPDHDEGVLGPDVGVEVVREQIRIRGHGEGSNGGHWREPRDWGGRRRKL